MMIEKRRLSILLSFALFLQSTLTNYPVPSVSVQVPHSDLPQSVLHFWFGGNPAANYREKWFPKDGSEQQRITDHAIRDRFVKVLQAAERGELSWWEDEPRTLLALIIVLDQFSRHIYRQKRDLILKNDVLALSKTEKMLRNMWDLEVRGI